MHPTERTLRHAFDADRFAVTRTVTDYRWLAPAVLAARERHTALAHYALDNPARRRPIRRAVGTRRWLGSLLVRLGVRLGAPAPADQSALTASAG